MSAAQARRHALPDPSKGHHAGLILSRYLKTPVRKGAEKDKEELFQAATKAIKENTSLRTLYRLAYERWMASLPKDARLRKFNTASRLIIGLGGENVTETGLTLHHTYGLPYLPGSALKGVAAHYARQVYGANDPSWHRTIFGATDEGGLIEFLDGWLTDTSLKNCLVDDVMTPHHGDYYMADEQDVREPTDFDTPVPVPFLAVRGAFQVALCKRDPRLPGEWLDTAEELLIRALSEFGIGGKTNAGYGRLTSERTTAKKPAEATRAAEVPVDEVELEIAEVHPAGRLDVITLDGSTVGTIANVDGVPAELRRKEQRIIGQRLSGDDPDNVRFRFIRAAAGDGAGGE